MPADLTNLQAAIDAAVTEVTADETVDAGAVTLITNFAASVSAAVTSALQADAAANATSIAAAADAINGVTARYTKAHADLGAALVANTPAA